VNLTEIPVAMDSLGGFALRERSEVPGLELGLGYERIALFQRGLVCIRWGIKESSAMQKPLEGLN
jgi:hypothetical protein